MARKKASETGHIPEAWVKGCPTCFGKFVEGRRCDCQYAESCSRHTETVREQLREQRQWEYHSVQLSPWMDKESDSVGVEEMCAMLEDEGGDNPTLNFKAVQFFTWLALEHPMTARALMLRMEPGVKNLADVAEKLGVTRQAVQKRIKVELGVAKRQYKGQEVFNLSEREFRVYQLCIQQKISARKAAKEMGISEFTVRKTLKVLKEKGYVGE